MLLGLKGMALAGGVALVVGFGAGWKTRDAFCDAATAKAAVESLKIQLAARDAAANQDAERARLAEEAKAKLEGVARELEARISSGECLSGDDAERLRSLWR